jgi:hypothetical protein
MHLSRVLFGRLVLVALPALALAACGGNSFSAGSSEPDGSVAEAGPDGDIIVGPGHDAGRDATAHDASAEDAHADARSDGGEPDGSTQPEAGKDAAPDAPGCPAGYLDCGGTCTLDNVNNCGTCGHDCANLPHVSGGVTCSAAGVCTFTNADCAPGWAHCTSNPDDGCETNITVSPNCGTCGKVCNADAGVPMLCNGTACVSNCSGSTPDLCNGTTCTNTTSDTQNCGTCDHICPNGPSSSIPTCNASVCGFSCINGTTGCPASSPTSCDNLTNDSNNCGACGTTCHAPASGTVACVSSNCVQACGTGLSLCQGTGQGPYGSCVNETDDTSNCGACGNVCGEAPNKLTPPNGVSLCLASTCDFKCTTAGYTKCEAQWECLAPPATGSAFVSAGSGFTPSSTGGCGTAAQPCENLSDGVIYAFNQGYQHLYLSHGTYGTDAPVQFQAAGSLTVSGGWTYTSGTWTPDCAPLPSTTTIVSFPGASQAVLVSGGAVTIDTLTIQNNTAAATGQSLYGVLVTDAQPVTLNNVDIQVAAGGNGQPGSTGPNAQPLPTCTADTGASGAAPGGTGPAGSSSSSYGANGYTPGTAGTGGNGSNGANGTAASTMITCVNSVSCRVVVGVCQPNTTSSCGTVGTNGCGTTGAGGGTGGTGGGASIGIYVGSSATVTVNGGAITTANGGTGGAGGAPGSQVPGTPGQAGKDGPTVCEQDNNCGTAPTCAISCAKMGFSAGGTAGGNGGEGAAGGQGGGGAGGDSHCYALAGGGSVTLNTTSCTTGSGGTGGLPNGPAGSNTVHN